MPLINIKQNQKFKEEEFKSEKELHETVESNLSQLLNMELVVSEYPTSNGGIIDTLALDKENGAPVIIEYKIDKSKTILNQLIFYYDWINDHRDTYNRLVKEKFKDRFSVNWQEDIRLICIAKDYSEWDFALVRHLDANIELFKYAYYSSGLLNLEAISINNRRKIIKISQNEFDLEYHRNKGHKETQQMFDELREKVLQLDDNIEERATKFYIGYKKEFIFAEIHIYRAKLEIYIKAKTGFKDPKGLTKDISHLKFSVNRKFYIKSKNQITDAIFLIKQSLEGLKK